MGVFRGSCYAVMDVDTALGFEGKTVKPGVFSEHRDGTWPSHYRVYFRSQVSKVLGPAKVFLVEPCEQHGITAMLDGHGKTCCLRVVEDSGWGSSNCAKATLTMIGSAVSLLNESFQERFEFHADPETILFKTELARIRESLTRPVLSAMIEAELAMNLKRVAVSTGNIVTREMEASPLKHRLLIYLNMMLEHSMNGRSGFIGVRHSYRDFLLTLCMGKPYGEVEDIYVAAVNAVVDTQIYADALVFYKNPVAMPIISKSGVSDNCRRLLSGTKQCHLLT